MQQVVKNGRLARSELVKMGVVMSLGSILSQMLGERRRTHLVIGVLLLLSLPLPGVAVIQDKQTRQVSVDSLIYDLKSPDALRRKEAAISLGNNKIEKAVPDLVAAAGDSDPGVRREVVIALDKMLDIRALPAFVRLMSDPEKEIRDRCITGLINLYLPKEGGLVVTFGKVANFLNPWSDEWADVIVDSGIPVDRTAVAALAARMQDSDEGIRARAARALGILRGREAVQALVESLNNDRSNTVRFEVVRAFRKIGDPSVGKDLMNYISYSDSKVRNESVYALGWLRCKEAVPELTRLYEKESALPSKQSDKTYRECLMNALALIADSSSRDLLIKESKSPDDVIRLHAFEGLARIGDASIVTDISRDRLQEKEPRIRTAQAYALYRMGRKEFLDEVVNALGNKKTSQEARQCLLELKPAELPELYAEVKNDDVSVREGLAEVIGILGDSQAIPVLQELGKDRRGQISALANQAIRKISARTSV